MKVLLCAFSSKGKLYKISFPLFFLSLFFEVVILHKMGGFFQRMPHFCGETGSVFKGVFFTTKLHSFYVIQPPPPKGRLSERGERLRFILQNFFFKTFFF